MLADQTARLQQVLGAALDRVAFVRMDVRLIRGEAAVGVTHRRR
jgi:hypothetical protein